jgi:hypothetical protein
MSHNFTVAYPAANSTLAEAFIQRVQDEYQDLTIERIELSSADAPMPSGAVVAVLFDNEFSATAEHTQWLTKWNDHRATTPLLPIAIGSQGKPPDPIGGLKSRFAAKDESEVLRSIGAMMGLALRPGKNKIFVSHRSVDGAESARKVDDYLNACGYCAWRDEGRDVGDNPNLEVGQQVQLEIEERLSEANAVILIDTPMAPGSFWVREEVRIALGKMIPIYPVVLHPKSEETSAGRFQVLHGLHRRICIESNQDPDGQFIFPDDDLPKVLSSVEDYLKSVYRNRVVQPREMERWFSKRDWFFGVNDLRPHLHHGKVGEIPDVFSLLACCSFEDTLFPPRLRAFAEDIRYLAQNSLTFTRNLYLYPGATRNTEDIKYVMTDEVPTLATQNAMLLSYNEAIARISSMTGRYYE